MTHQVSSLCFGCLPRMSFRKISHAPSAAHALISEEFSHLQEGVEENLGQRLRHGEVTVAGADFKSRLQTLNSDCGAEM